MPRDAGIKVVNKFSRGLITEATGLNFPEDAVVECDNVIFDSQSIARRRKGFDYETEYDWNTVTNTEGKSIGTYLWRNAGGSSLYNFVVTQVGNLLYFWQTDGFEPLSSQFQAGTINLNSFRANGAGDISLIEAQFATGLNYLFVSHPNCDPFFVAYDVDAGTFTATEITINIRDFEGVDDNLDVEFRPNSLSKLHHYNLNNQGWYRSVVISENGTLRRPIAYFKLRSEDKKYPSNADIWWLMKDANEFFDPNNKGSVKAFGNTPAPNGHYILNAFREDRSDVSNINGIPVVSAGPARPSSIAFFAGRVWYAGVQTRRLGSSIYFSQITDDDEKLGDCYQSNDPTSEVTPDLLPTDGGVIKIPDIGTVYKLLPIQTSMMVFASNGVWAISGSEGIGFTANDYSIRKISSVGAVSASSFADVEGLAIWWNNDGIYTISTDNIGNYGVESITDESIKTYYGRISASSKKYVKASYNSLKRTIQWLYRSTEEQGISDRYEYDKILTFDLISKGFYPFTLNTSVRISAMISFEGAGTDTIVDGVVDSTGDSIIDSTNAFIVTNSTTVREFSSITKFLTINPTDSTLITWSEESNPNYLDWYTFDGTGQSYTSTFTTGYSIEGKAVNFTQPNYVFVYINQETDASCYMDGIFDWAANASSNRYSNQQQVYNSNRADYAVRVRKLKVRGKGRSIQLRFTSDPGKPFSIIGWAMFVSGNQVP